MKSINWLERGSTGAPLMSIFHQFPTGNTWRPTSGSFRTGGAAASTLTLAQRVQMARDGRSGTRA
jgi:hypothetical protein